MWRSSKEKRAVALKLTVKLASLVPSEYIPVVLSENMIRSVVLSRLKTSNLLFEFAGGILKELVNQVEGDNERTLSLLTAFSQHGGMNFDKRTSTNTVQALIEKLDATAIRQYIKLLCELIGSYDESSEKKTDSNGAEDDEADEEEKASPAISAVHSLLTLARLNNVADKEDIQLSVLSILSRLGCFAHGETKSLENAEKKNKKNKTKKEETSKINSNINSFSVECVRILEKGTLKQIIPAEIANVAALQLIALASELALKSSSSTHSTADEVSTTAVDHPAIYRLWALINHMVSSNLVPRFKGVTEDGDDDDHEMTEFDLPQFINGIHTHIEYFSGLIRDAKSDENLKRLIRFAEAASTLLIIGTVHVLTSGDIEKITIMQAAIVMKELSEKAKANGFGEEKEYDEEFDDEDDSLELRLFENCTELLSLSNDQAIKGLRESIKRVWNALFPLIGEDNLSQSFMDALVGQVTDPEDYDQQEEGNHTQNQVNDDDEEEDDGGSDQEEDDEEDEEVDENDNKYKKEIQSKIAAKRKEAEEQEDLVVQEDDMIDFLMVDDEELNAELGLNGEEEDESDDDGAVVHTAEADAALVKLIQMKKENRKQGLLAAKRKQILLRSRLLDILEILIGRVRSGTVIFSLFVPMILGVKKVLTSKLIQEIAEGRPFAQRLQNLLTNQLCKKKFSLKIAEDEELISECNEELDIIIEITMKLLSSKIQPLRVTAQETILAVARAMISSDSVSSQEKISSFFQAITKKFITMRRCQIPSKWLEEVVVNRFPQFFLPSLWSDFIGGISAPTTNAFVRNELLEMSTTILKKFQSMDSKTQDAIFTQLPQLFITLSGSIDESIKSYQSSSSAGNSKESKAKKDGQSQSMKKLRNTVTCLKTAIDSIVRAKRDLKSMDKAMHRVKSSLESAKDFSTNTVGVSPSIGQISEQSLSLLASVIVNKPEVRDNKKDLPLEESKGTISKKDKKRQIENVSINNSVSNNVATTSAKKPKMKK